MLREPRSKVLESFTPKPREALGCPRDEARETKEERGPQEEGNSLQENLTWDRQQGQEEKLLKWKNYKIRRAEGRREERQEGGRRKGGRRGECKEKKYIQS